MSHQPTRPVVPNLSDNRFSNAVQEKNTDENKETKTNNISSTTTHATTTDSIETKPAPTSSSPNKPTPSFQTDHFKRPTSIPSHATAKSVTQMEKSILENPHNHCAKRSSPCMGTMIV